MFRIFGFLFILIFGISKMQGQWIEKFSDGNFLVNPAWEGDTGRFTVNASFQLQSKGTLGTTGETSILVAPYQGNGRHRWEFYARQNFSPSTQNYARFYLMADQAALNSANALYIQLGGSTGNTDSLSIYRQTPTGRYRVLAGLPSTMGRNINPVRVRVELLYDGTLNLYSDTSGNNNFVLESSTTFNDIPNYVYTGVFCRYTASNINNFIFDDISIENIKDTIPPTIDSAWITGNSTVDVKFSEAILKDSIQNSAIFSGNGGLGKPFSVLLKPDGRTVELTFFSPFQSNYLYTVTIQNVYDTAKNSTGGIQFNFMKQAGLLAPVINEIFPDPTPAVGLPEFEFIEIYNPNSVPLSLLNYTLSDGSTTGTISNAFGNPTIEPDSFVIICSNSSAADFQGFGKVIPLSPFPSLNNSGDAVILRDPLGNVVSSVNYTDQWYQNTNKSQGGYTLEKINPMSSCQGSANWMASEDPNGGTPGKRNSVYKAFGDTTSPVVKKVYYKDAQTVYFIFSEPADTSSTGWSLTGASFQSSYFSSQGDTLFILLNTPLVHKNEYKWSISGIKDCNANSTLSGGAFIYYAIRQAQRFDVVVSEIYAAPLSNARLPNAEFIELYNRTDSAISLSGWTLKDGGGSIGKIIDYMLPPGAHLVLCSENLASRFGTQYPILGLSTFPSLNNDKEWIYLFNEKQFLIHRAVYNENLHSPSTKKGGGWTLEMIDPSNPCDERLNWASSVASDGGTPGKINSVNRSNPDISYPEIVAVYPENPQLLRIQWSEILDSTSAIQLASYSISPNPGISKLESDGQLFWFITLDQPLQLNTEYVFTCSGLKDCAGNPSFQKSIAFGLPSLADSGDLVINEILSEPFSGGQDFIEIYNRSSKFIDLKDVYISKSELGAIQDLIQISPAGWIIGPRKYLCLSGNSSSVTQFYTLKDSAQILEMSSFPSLSTSDGEIGLNDFSGRWFDLVKYTDDWHNPLISETRGISLERVFFDRPSFDPSNWQSASSISGGATPGYINSQFNGANPGGEKLEFSPDIFSPDGDGVDDNLSVMYTLKEPGYAGIFNIYNPGGNRIKELTQKVPLGLSGTITWNGTDDSGNLAATGIYIVVFEYFNANGRRGVIRKTCNLITRQ